MRLAFMGSPDFALPSLKALMAAGHSIACVYAQPPRPAGRGQQERPCPAHAFALAHGIPARTPRTLRDPAEQAAFAALDLDCAVTAAYGLILPKAVLDAPRLGCLNVHGSLLPRWRGAAPIQRAILAGDTETGITIMRMDEGLDTGPTLMSAAIPIAPAATAGELHDVLAELGAKLIVPVLEGLALGTLSPVAQPEAGVTYAAKLDKAETRLDWSRPAAELERVVRAFAPFPGAWFELADERIKVLLAEAVAGSGEPGTVLDDRLTVACGEDALRPARVQRAGKGAMDADAFLRGRGVAAGTRVA